LSITCFNQLTTSSQASARRIAVQTFPGPILAKLVREHPDLTVEIHTNNAFVEIFDQGFDADYSKTIRISARSNVVIGNQERDSHLVASNSYE